MAQPLNNYFLRDASKALQRANDELGRRIGQPNGAVAVDASDQELSNHAALIEVVTALESFQNWADDLSANLMAAGIVELVTDDPR